MDRYEVVLYPRAYKDIDEIYSYIALEKLDPENARSQTDRIDEKNKRVYVVAVQYQGRNV